MSETEKEYDIRILKESVKKTIDDLDEKRLENVYNFVTLLDTYSSEALRNMLFEIKL